MVTWQDMSEGNCLLFAPLKSLSVVIIVTSKRQSISVLPCLQFVSFGWQDSLWLGQLCNYCLQGLYFLIMVFLGTQVNTLSTVEIMPLRYSDLNMLMKLKFFSLDSHEHVLLHVVHFRHGGDRGDVYKQSLSSHQESKPNCFYFWIESKLNCIKKK